MVVTRAITNFSKIHTFLICRMQKWKKMVHHWTWLIIWKWHFLGKFCQISTFWSGNQHETNKVSQCPNSDSYQINFWIVRIFSKKATLKLSLMSNDENKFLPIFQILHINNVWFLLELALALVTSILKKFVLVWFLLVSKTLPGFPSLEVKHCYFWLTEREIQEVFY